VPRRRLPELAALGAVAFAALGAFPYALNVLHTGHATGAVSENTRFRAEPSPRGAAATGARVIFRFVDFPGLNLPPAWLSSVAGYGRSAFEAAGIDSQQPGATATPFFFFPNGSAHEDRAYFGPLGFLLVLPLVLLELGRLALGKSDRRRAILALALPSFFAVLAVAYTYDDWIGRFLIGPVALTLPLAAALYRFRQAAAATVVVAIATLACARTRSA
jgi:hypothetical protein